MFSACAISRIRDSTRGQAQERRRHECSYRIFTDENKERVFVTYDIVFHAVDENRERASHESIPYFWVPCKESPEKSRWPSDDKEVVDEGKSRKVTLATVDKVGERKSSEVTLAIGRRRGCRRR